MMNLNIDEMNRRLQNIEEKMTKMDKTLIRIEEKFIKMDETLTRIEDKFTNIDETLTQIAENIEIKDQNLIEPSNMRNWFWYNTTELKIVIIQLLTIYAFIFRNISNFCSSFDSMNNNNL